MATRNLVLLNHDTPITTSLIIAKYFEKRHDNVMQAIERAKSSLLKFKDAKNAIIPSTYTDEQGKPRPMYLLNRDGFNFVVMKFTGDKAAEWQWRFIKAFDKMADYIASISDKERTTLKLWDFSKIGRREMTDVVQKFNKRDYIDGDKNPQARGRYARLTKDTQIDVVGIPAGGRSVAEPEKLARLIFSEKAVANSLNRAYEKGESFSQAERRAVDTAKNCQLLFNGELQALLDKAAAS